ncbi:exonuclease SbcCD subunit D [Nocardioides acrostichi]|uniref:Nuclease SbcCD subunit D n=1 Tax=Nocardioides acrostichi TaxID=2784339 RepID=A0A930YES6_9ACTN|nr:exonuclease SbcCD subunit D [Nocardioides acrostichi]MBF4163764.1 exonuclease SbcCD subunit D [Nocardioides acrostichi]
MRLLHTSDWHLGRSFHREGMLEHQAAFVDHLLEVVEHERVDAVLVAGDVYDRALPPVDAVRLADETLARLAASRARVVLTSGNHDSAHRLGFGSRLADMAGVHLRTQPGTVGAPVLLADDHGEVAVHGLPYLDPQTVAPLWGTTASHAAVLGEAMCRVRRDLAARPGVRSIVMAHAFVGGAGPVQPQESDSERDISVGGVSLVPTGVFDGIDYTALGHLHGRHVLGDRVRYSGSPLAYSFSEAAHRKGSWLVDLDADALHAEFVDAPVPRRVARLRGTLEELLTDQRHAAHEQSWVQATLTDDVRPTQAMERLRRRFPHALVLAFESTAPSLGGVPARPSQGRTDHDVVTEFFWTVRGAGPTADEAALLREAVDSCCEESSV